MNDSLVHRAASFIWKMLKNYFMIVGFSVTLLSLVAMYVSNNIGASLATKKLASNEVVTIDLILSGQVVDKYSAVPKFIQLIRRPGENRIYLPEFRKTVRKLAADSRVNGIFLEIRQLKASLAQFSEIRDTLEEFKASGKPIFGWLDTVSSPGQYLAATVAEKLYLPPQAQLIFNGPNWEGLYFRDALNQLGVRVRAVATGKYKSAIEPLTRMAPSPAALENMTALQSAILGKLVSDISTARSIEHSVIKEAYRQTILTAAEAVKMKLFDDMKYRDEAEDELDKFIGGKLVTLGEYQSSSQEWISLIGNGEEKADEPGIALIEATGLVALGSPGDNDNITPAAFRRRVKWALEEDKVKAILLRISSPGGVASAGDQLWHIVNSAVQKKPVIVSAGTVMASAGYYMATPATKIFADELSVTGSIGVFSAVPDAAEFAKKWGIASHSLSTSDRNRLFELFKEPTQDDLKVLQASSNRFYQTFLEKVAEGRRMSLTDVDKIAQGRVWTGIEAKQKGLVDEIGGLEKARQAACEIAGLATDAEVTPVFRYSRGDDFWSCLESGEGIGPCLQEFSMIDSDRNPISYAVEVLQTLSQHPVQMLWAEYFLLDNRI